MVPLGALQFELCVPDAIPSLGDVLGAVGITRLSTTQRVACFLGVFLRPNQRVLGLRDGPTSVLDFPRLTGSIFIRLRQLVPRLAQFEFGFGDCCRRTTCGPDGVEAPFSFCNGLCRPCATDCKILGVTR